MSDLKQWNQSALQINWMVFVTEDVEEKVHLWWWILRADLPRVSKFNSTNFIYCKYNGVIKYTITIKKQFYSSIFITQLCCNIHYCILIVLKE